MLLYFPLIFAEYFRIYNSNKYLGLENGNLVAVMPQRAVEIHRRGRSAFANQTLLEITGYGPIYFNNANYAVANMYEDIGSLFNIVMGSNGFFILISDEQCIFEIDNIIARGNCSHENYTYFEITPIIGRGTNIYHHNLRAGIKDKSFNRFDPLAINWTEISDYDKSTVLIPYYTRLKDMPDIKLDEGLDYERIFNFHPPFIF